MLSVRLMWAAALLVPALALAVLDYQVADVARGVFLYPLGAALTLVASWELHRLCRPVLGNPSATLWLIATLCPILALAVAVYAPLVHRHQHALHSGSIFAWTLGGQFAALVFVSCSEMRSFRYPESGAVLRLAGTAWAVLYLSLPLAFLVATRWLGPNDRGMLALVTLVFTVKLSDSGAYLVGSLFGKRKLAPYLSPQKTVEGALGGVGFALFAAILMVCAVRPWLVPDHRRAVHWSNGLGWLALALALAVVAAAGDLAESLIKREVRQKDSGRWLPGLGGALDLLDSLLWTAAVNYAFWSWEWVD